MRASLHKKLSRVFLSFLILGSASAQDFNLKQLHISHPFAHPTVTGAPSGAAYFTLENIGHKSDSLIQLTSPIAQSVTLHSMSTDHGIMRMREVTTFTIAPGKKWDMSASNDDAHSYHVMLMGLKHPLKVGDTFPLTLTFKKSGRLTLLVKVEEQVQ